ncbi:MAG: cell division protein ZipA C-terminal FtsZ-binding domain-containing protein [Halorhodospira sp.]
MDMMRWIILGVGVLVLIGIYALGRWRERRRQKAVRPPQSTGPAADRAVGSSVGGPRRGGEPSMLGDDELRGIDDLLADEELAPDGFDLGLEPSQEGAGMRSASQQQADVLTASDPLAADTRGLGGSSAGSEATTAASEEAEELAGADRAAASTDRNRHTAATGPDAASAGAQAPSAEPVREQRTGRDSGGDEPPPLSFPPASRVEINAYRSGGIPEAEKLMLAFVVAGEGQRFRGPEVGAALHAVRMVPGEHRIWHRRGESEAGRVTLFSAANMVEPGYLDPEETLPALETPGLAFFMQLPLPVDSEEVLDTMLATAYQVSVHLGGELLDSTRSTMTQQIAEHMREQLREHRRQLHLAMHKRQ